MKFKEIRTVEGVLRGFFNEAGAYTDVKEVLEVDEDGNVTDTPKAGCEIIVATAEEKTAQALAKAQAEAQWQNTEYQRQRRAEYPPIADYIDGVVKGDQAQIDAYVAACQAVKAKYPKP